MTTVILAIKLLSLKTGEGERKKIQDQNRRNMQEISQTKRSLQKSKYHKAIDNCRLCLRPAEKNIFINENSKIAENIKIILNIEIQQDDGKPQYICVPCESTVFKAAELRETAEITQWRLQQEAEMVCESANYDAIVDDYNSFDDEILPKYASKNHELKKNLNKNVDCKQNKSKTKRLSTGPYICETCGLELKTLSRLKTHRLVHTNDFNHSCAHCPYRTRNRYSLQIHERKHTGDRPYECAQCHATFLSTSNLASHRRSHLPPAFICDICNKGFKFKQPLLNHIATQHRSAKPFFCCICENSFATRKLLRRHERKIHNRPKLRVGATPSYIKSQEDIDRELLDYNKS